MEILNTEFRGGSTSTYNAPAEYEEMDFYQIPEIEQAKHILNSYMICAEVRCNEYDYSLIVDPEGYEYARHVAIVGNYNPEPEKGDNKEKENTINIEYVHVDATENTEALVMSASDSQTVNNVDIPVINFNEDKNGVELKYNGKPSQNVIDSMKAAGFRWSKFNKVWWSKQTPEAMKYIKGLQTEEHPEEAETVTAAQEQPGTVTVNNIVSLSDYRQEKEEDIEIMEENFDMVTDGNSEEGFSLNDILGAFEEVEVTADTRISEQDKNYCEEQERLYKEAVTVMQNTLETFKAIYRNNGYIEQYKDIGNIEDRIKDFKSDFINRICWYFEKQYKVTIDEDVIRKNYDNNVTYAQVVEEIILQLGGFSFQEKAENEIKDAMRENIHRSEKINIKNGKLTVTDYIWWDHSWDNNVRIGYSDGKVLPLMKALSLFENGSTETLNSFTSILEQLRDGSKNKDIFKKYEFEWLNKIKAFKAFKNGKVEITFASTKQAEEFAREYCGWTPDQSKAV